MHRSHLLHFLCPYDTAMKAPATKPVNKAPTKRRAFGTPSSRAGNSAVGSKPENPFDKFANARKKHEVLNRRVKGEDRNMGRARDKAIDERKTKLLKDYNSSKKSNVIVDKRFGESDPTMSLEEKMFLRFQREKVKSVRNSSAFNLDGGDTEILTHKGQILGNSNLDDNDWVSSDEEGGGGRLNKQVVDSLHFGGGLQQKRSNVAEEMGPVPKGRLDALQEIVMKSKLHKMQKKEAKEEQEEERSKLDQAYKELFSSSMLDFNPTGAEKKYGRSERAPGQAAEALDDYDLSLREMTYEAKLPASERTKTAEEIALEEQKRIEELEEARLKRMKGSGKSSAEGDDADGKSQKRPRRTDDEIDDSTFQTVAKGKRGRAGREAAQEEAEAAEVSGAAYRDYIMQDEEYSDSESGSGSDEGEDEEDEEDDEGSGDDHEEDGEGSDVDAEEVGSDSEPEGEGSGESEEDEDEEEQPAPVTKKGDATTKAALALSKPAVTNKLTAVSKTRAQAVPDDVEEGVNIEMPHKIDCPPDLEAFDELVDQYVRNGNADMCALIDRILRWNNVHLPGAEGKENRNLMHNFLDVLLKHFIRVGDSLSNLDGEQQRESTQMVSLMSICSLYADSELVAELFCL
jgi:nucleolar protein 14